MATAENLAMRLAAAREADRIYAAEDIGQQHRADHAYLLVNRLAHETSRAVQEAIFNALSELGVDAVASFFPSLLASDDPYIRNQAVTLLHAGAAKSARFVRELLNSTDRDIRKLAVDVLSGIHCDEAADLYAIALRDADMNVVITAMESIRPPQDVRLAGLVLQKVLEADHPMLLLSGLEALLCLNHPSAYACLRTRFSPLSAVDAIVLPHMIKLAGQHGREAEMNELMELLPRCAPETLVAAFDAIHLILSRGVKAPGGLDRQLCSAISREPTRTGRYRLLVLAGDYNESPAVLEVLASHLSSPEQLDRLGAVEGLAAHGTIEARCCLRARLATETNAEVIDALTAALAEEGGD